MADDDSSLSGRAKGALLFAAGAIAGPLIGAYATGNLPPHTVVYTDLIVVTGLLSPFVLPGLVGLMSPSLRSQMNAAANNFWVWLGLIMVWSLYSASFLVADYCAKRVAYYSNPAAATPQQIQQKHVALTESLQAFDFPKVQVCPPIPTPSPATMAQRTIPPHEITLDDGLKVISDLRFIQGSVELKVVAPPDNRNLRNRLLYLFQFPQSLVPPFRSA